ncbi:hypothetical protein QBC32DRAFT_319720 [Pseudoneurospora amorphoporcata]|uniref:Uncharacterized protein n=1 Tax=Pseudoneurospora amorphoporcata TaxID=241081 RepID=A0AAN6NIZ5_9PEZI|nr:hypothetical protein QBC32DRAFT_319720 [Pseudoneurospora amorphoporcata]
MANVIDMMDDDAMERKKEEEIWRSTRGVWAIDFADKFPKCNVIGTNISPIPPSWVPPNVTFEINDFYKEWTFKEDN